MDIITKKLEYFNAIKESRLENLKEKTVPQWIKEEVKYGFMGSETKVCMFLTEYFIPWLTELERFEDAAWLTKELDNFAKKEKIFKVW